MRARSFSLACRLAVVPLVIGALALGGCDRHQRREIQRQVNGGDEHHGGEHGRRHERGEGREDRREAREHRHEGAGEGERDRSDQSQDQSQQQSQQQQAQQQSPAPAAAPATHAPATQTTAGELPLLYDQVDKPAYKPAYTALLGTMDRVPRWVSRGGTASPGRVVTIAGAQYESYSHCKPHDCGDNMMYVLFSRDLKHAWALMVRNGRARYFGNPNADQTAFLKREACHDSALQNC